MIQDISDMQMLPASQDLEAEIHNFGLISYTMIV